MLELFIQIPIMKNYLEQWYRTYSFFVKKIKVMPLFIRLRYLVAILLLLFLLDISINVAFVLIVWILPIPLLLKGLTYLFIIWQIGGRRFGVTSKYYKISTDFLG